MPGTLTLVFRVEMDAPTEEVIRRFACESAKWGQAVFGRWYADFRSHRNDLSTSVYNGLVTAKAIRGTALGKPGLRQKWRVNVRGKSPNLYSLFLTRDRRVEPAVPTGGVTNSALHGTLCHLGTVIDGFLDHDLRRDRCHDRRVLRRRREARAREYHSTSLAPWNPNNFYPRLKPVARFGHAMVSWEWAGKLPTRLRFTDPFGHRGRKLEVTIPPSADPRYWDRMGLVLTALSEKKQMGVELHYHDDGSREKGWYAHVAVPIAVPAPAEEVHRVMGIDVGERNIGTTVILGGPDPAHDRIGKPKLYHGLGIRHRLEIEHVRVRQLRRASDRTGKPSVKAAYSAAKGKQRRVLNTLIHTVSADVVKQSVLADVDGIVMEDISKFRPALRNPGKGARRLPGAWGKQMRRLLSRWNRGDLQHAIRYKAENAGIRIAGPRGTGIYPVLTSLRCPRCGVVDPKARRNHLFVCKQPSCGYRDHDDVTGALNIAARGYAYFAGKPLPGSPPSPPSEPGHASTGGDPPKSSGDGGGATSWPSTTAGGTTGTPSQPPQNSENGAGSAVVVQAANRPPPTGGGGCGIVDRPTNHSDKRGPPGRAAASERQGGDTQPRSRSQVRSTTESGPAKPITGVGRGLTPIGARKRANPTRGDYACRRNG